MNFPYMCIHIFQLYQSQFSVCSQNMAHVSWEDVCVSIHVVQPVDEVEESERDGENHARPLVNGAYIRQVGDFELEFGRAPPQAAVGAAAHGTALQRVMAEAVARGTDRLAELHARAVKRHDGVARVTYAATHVRRHHLVVHLQRGEQDVAVSVHLDQTEMTKRQTQSLGKYGNHQKSHFTCDYATACL